jgi:amino-acid N-acetyltransferase
MKTPAAGAEDYGLIRSVLVASELPVEGPFRKCADPIPHCRLPRRSVRWLHRGLEVHTRDGLARSLAVPSDLRAHGVGKTLVDAVQRLAAAEGIERLWLLLAAMQNRH